MYKFNTSPAYSIPKSKKKNKGDINHSIGPGSYKVQNLDAVKENAKKTVFGKSKRQNEKSLDTPGPGMYEAQNKHTIKGSYFTKKFDKKFSQNQIGPGSYDVQFQSNKNKGVKFATYQDKNLKQNYQPGPGEYYNANLYTDFKQIPNRGKFSMSPKTKFISRDSPGPGQYNIDKIKNKQNQTFSKSSRYNQNKNTTPGYVYDQFIKNLSNKGGYIAKQNFDTKKPLSQIPFYNNQSTYHKKFKNNSTGKFGHSKRQINLGGNLMSPGPGQYNTFVQKSKKGFIFSKNLKKSKKDFTPGPGQYNNQLNALSQKGFKFNKSKQNALNKDTPGPGTYDFFKTKLKNQTFAKRKRELFKENEVPGPGTYQFELNQKIKLGIISKDQHQKHQEIQPGPADYNLPPTLPLVAPYSVKK